VPEEVAGRALGMFMFNDKFLTLRSLLAGDSDRNWDEKNMERCEDSVGLWPCFGEAIILWNDESGTSEIGDSGDELGDGSVIDGEPKVDTVVVGEESVESELTEAALS
jgi:hypothetical protein